jgi:hypothetical protein
MPHDYEKVQTLGEDRYFKVEATLVKEDAKGWKLHRKSWPHIRVVVGGDKQYYQYEMPVSVARTMAKRMAELCEVAEEMV